MHSSKLLDNFRAQTGRKNKNLSAPFPLREKFILFLASIQILFLGFCFGGYPNWALFTYLPIACLSFIILFIPMDPWLSPTVLQNIQKLIKFPIFWLGLLFIGYILLQAKNPSWTYQADDKAWWLRKIAHKINWPSCIESPFEQLNPYRVALFILSGYLMSCALWVGITRRRSIIRLLWVIVITGLLFACLGFYLKLTNSNELMGIKHTSVETFFASFIYKNHAGAYLNIALSASLALFLYYLNQTLSSFQKSSPYLVCSLSSLILCIAIFYSLSRGAILMMALLLLAFFIATLILLIKKSHNPYAKWATAFLMIIIVSSTYAFHEYYDWKELERRFKTLEMEITNENESRNLLRKASYEMFQDNSTFGWGAGSYRFYFPVYRDRYPHLARNPNNPGKSMNYQHAHCDWVQFLAEYGIVGSSILGSILLWFIAHLGIYCKRFSYFHFMLLMGIAAFCTHSTFDFIFQNPVLVIIFCIMATLLTKSLTLRQHSEG